MTTINMTCDRLDLALSSYLEGDVDLETRNAIDAHVSECLRCAGLLRDLERIERMAKELPTLEPSHDLWDGIATRINAPVIRLEPGNGSRSRHIPMFWLGAAAAALVAVTAGTTYVITSRANTGSHALASNTAPQSPSLVQPAGNAVSTGLTYDQEIGRLRGIVEQRRADLDPATIATVQSSLAMIDRAIADARSALATDTSSAFLHDQLNKALEKKLGVLRTVATLPPRT